jgi:hypothetical protein
MKYIVISHDAGLPAAILFNEALLHRDVAAGHKVLGAGFCDVRGRVWGFSESLGVPSRTEDAAHVRLALNLSLQPAPQLAETPISKP